FEQFEIGGTSYDLTGSPLTDGTITACKSADAILLGAVGGPKWDNIPVNVRPEKGLLKIRKELNLFSIIRPIKGFDSLLHASTLKEKNIKVSDILIVRDLNVCLYFCITFERHIYRSCDVILSCYLIN